MLKEEHMKIVNESITKEAFDKALNMIQEFLTGGLVVQKEQLTPLKAVQIERVEDVWQLSVYGTYIPQDGIKNQLVFKDINKATLLEFDESSHTLLIGTHSRVDGIFTTLQKILEDVIDKDVVRTFDNVSVTDGDFIGKNVAVFTIKGPVTKGNRHAV